MKINLYYVEGISRIDTPSFNTKTHIGTIQDQEEFFLTKLKKSIDMTFYPPYYRNSIKFDQDDLVITDNVNYLSLEYNGKTYYYFIDEINYTSTGIITLEVSMDTIQTFMFDIYISSGIIERKFINRWLTNDDVIGYGHVDKINRNYKRENVSSNLFELYEHYDIPMPKNEMLIVSKECKVQDGQYTGVCVHEEIGINKQDVFYPCEVRFGPYFDGHIEVGNDNQEYHPEYFINMMARNAYISELFLIPFKCLDNIIYYPNKWWINDTKYQYNDITDRDKKWFIAKHEVEFTGLVSKIPTVHNYDIYTFNYLKNTNKGVLFNSIYMPVMLDENYQRIIFGSRSANTAYPLYKLNYTKIITSWYADVINGSRFYYITANNTWDTSIYNHDEYRTLCADYEPIKLDLISDAYAQFDATNKFRWLEAIGVSAVSAFTLFTGVYSKAAFAAKDIATIAATSLTPKRRKLSKKGQRAINAIERKQEENAIDTIGDTIKTLSPISNNLIQEMNMSFAPDSIKQAGFTVEISSISYQIFRDIERVNDYEQCAHYYHHNGYLIHEYITQVSNIFLSVRNRYYFDVLKMSLPEVHLHNIIEDEDTVGLIEERLETGLRLWNVKNSDVIMGDFTYDNVELDYLS